MLRSVFTYWAIPAHKFTLLNWNSQLLFWISKLMDIQIFYRNEILLIKQERQKSFTYCMEHKKIHLSEVGIINISLSYINYE
jgi:hypothetical protein